MCQHSLHAACAMAVCHTFAPGNVYNFIYRLVGITFGILGLNYQPTSYEQKVFAICLTTKFAATLIKTIAFATKYWLHARCQIHCTCSGKKVSQTWFANMFPQVLPTHVTDFAVQMGLHMSLQTSVQTFSKAVNRLGNSFLVQAALKVLQESLTCQCTQEKYVTEQFAYQFTCLHMLQCMHAYTVPCTVCANTLCMQPLQSLFCHTFAPGNVYNLIYRLVGMTFGILGLEYQPTPYEQKVFANCFTTKLQPH